MNGLDPRGAATSPPHPPTALGSTSPPDHLLGKHFAELSLEILKLAAFCWAMVLVLAVIVVGALRLR